jgi:hypothetical protein
MGMFGLDPYNCGPAAVALMGSPREHGNFLPAFAKIFNTPRSGAGAMGPGI